MKQPKPVFGRAIDTQLAGVYDFSAFMGSFFVEAARTPFHWREIVRQCYDVGIRTIPLIALTGVITGIVFTQQSRPSLSAFGATSWLPSLVTLALIRSLAPLVTALVCAGKVGSSIGAEIGSMKVTEQLEAMEVSAINPFKYLVVTRTLATTLMIPALTMLFCFVGLVGAYFNVATNEGTTWTGFIQNGFSSLELLDIGASLFRAVTFGFTIGIISAYSGFKTSRGTKGVGEAANNAVVRSMLAVFLEEILIVQVITLLRGL